MRNKPPGPLLMTGALLIALELADTGDVNGACEEFYRQTRAFRNAPARWERFLQRWECPDRFTQLASKQWRVDMTPRPRRPEQHRTKASKAKARSVGVAYPPGASMTALGEDVPWRTITPQDRPRDWATETSLTS
jgi:hypothetical protein